MLVGWWLVGGREGKKDCMKEGRKDCMKEVREEERKGGGGGGMCINKPVDQR